MEQQSRSQVQHKAGVRTVTLSGRDSRITSPSVDENFIPGRGHKLASLSRPSEVLHGRPELADIGVLGRVVEAVAANA